MIRTCICIAALSIANLSSASEPVFLAVLEADAALESAFPGEVIENLWRQAELRTRRCRVEANDPAWLQRIETLAEDRIAAQTVEAAGRAYLLRDAMSYLSEAGLEAEMIEAFRVRAEGLDTDDLDLGSCRGFVSTLQHIYDRPQVGSASPAVIGTVCGQIQSLTDCHSQVPEAAARLPQ